MNIFRIISLAVCAAVLSGCQVKEFLSVPMVASNVGATFHNKELAMKDIPLPRDFILVDGSFWFGTPHFRYGEFLLEGSQPIEDVFDFYKKQMPGEVWTEISSQNLETAATLKYENKSEFCSILCQEKEMKTAVRIVIEQKKS